MRFPHFLRVAAGFVDEQGHVNIPANVRRMQEFAVALECSGQRRNVRRVEADADAARDRLKRQFLKTNLSPATGNICERLTEIRRAKEPSRRGPKRLPPDRPPGCETFAHPEVHQKSL